MDIKQEDGDNPVAFHPQMQIKQLTTDVNEKGEEQISVMRYEVGCGIELVSDHEVFNHEKKIQKTRNREIKQEQKEGEQWPEEESLGIVMEKNGSSDLRRLKILHKENSNTDAKERDFSEDEVNIEGSGVSIKTEPKEEVNEEIYVTCYHCGEKRKTKNELKNHIYSIHLSVSKEMQQGKGKSVCEEKINKCVFCQKTFQYKATLELHLRIHADRKPVNCDQYMCNTSVKFSVSMQDHKQIEENQFKCSYCEFNTLDSSSLRRHIRTHSRKKSFSCNFCEYSSSNKSHFKAHIRTHTGEKPFRCSYCEYSSSDPSSLRRHTRLHTGEKPFVCNLCEYSASDRSALVQHIKNHTGEKPFKCNVCEYSTSVRSLLKRHIRIHTGEKPFKCDMCDYSASRQTSLINHIRTHTRDKPFKCHFCEYSATQKSHVIRHMQVHTGEKPYRCNKCDYCATKNAYLKKHLLKHTENPK